MTRLILLLALLGVIGVGIFRGIFLGDASALQTVIVKGAGTETEQRVRERLKPRLGVSLWKLDMDEIARQLETDGWIDSVDIRRQLPHTLVIDVSERRPVAVLSSGRGMFKFVDKSNAVIGEVKPELIADYPILSGGNLIEKPDLRQKALELLNELPPDGTVSRGDISEVRFAEERGFQLVLSKTGMVIDLGKENIPLHLDRSRRVVQYLEQHRINATHIDSDYAKKVLVKVRKGR
jgi:cell division protein FtsQ